MHPTSTHRPRRRWSFALLLAVVALLAASCSGRSDSSSSSSSDKGSSGSSGSSSSGEVVNPDDCASYDGTAGVSGDTITLASSFPQSGLTAAFAQISKGYKAYFAKVNADGGVEVAGKKYKIEVVDKDDEYTPAKTVQNINEEVGADGSKAFAVFNVVGTANNVAVRASLGDNCVPNVFAATGSPVWGNVDYPWTIGSTLAPYTVEAKAFADYLKDNKPNAKVAMLVQDDDFGKAYEEGFKKQVEGSDITVVQVKSYKPGNDNVDSQVTSLAASGADTFFNGATLLACPNALKAAQTANWDATTFVSGTCISKTLMGIAGDAADKVFATTNIKDPMNPAFKDDEAMQEYRDTLAQYGAKDVDPDNGIVAYGYTQAALLVEILGMLPKLDRATLMNQMYDLKDVTGGLLIDGVKVNTSTEDRFLTEDVQMIQYDAANKYFTNVGPVLDFDGTTPDITPKDLINS
ncbi:MAG: ABC transporter substrate-binding protein [Acidimicrobiales bacterium]